MFYIGVRSVSNNLTIFLIFWLSLDVVFNAVYYDVNVINGILLNVVLMVGKFNKYIWNNGYYIHPLLSVYS